MHRAFAQEPVLQPTIQPEDLAQAIRCGELWPAFQPLVHIGTGTVAAFEVLLRWTSERFGAVPPPQIIQLALGAGLLNTITFDLIRTAAAQAAPWGEGFCLAFNTAPAQYLDEAFVPALLQTLQATGMPLCRFKIEVTEDDIFADTERAQNAVLGLQAAGVRLSLDDFGTGHSSLTRLQMLPFDEIKIDASFVRALESAAGDRRIVSAVVGLGQSLEMNVVAEGVESAEQARVLQQIGCTLGQGYYWSAPVPAPQAAAFVASHGIWSRQGEGIDTSPFQRLYQLEAMYREAPVGLCFLDTNLRVASTNRILLEYLGIPHDQVVGRSITKLLDPVLNADMIAALQAVHQGHMVPPAEYLHGQTGRNYLVSHQRVLDSAHSPLGVSVVVLDITERVQAAHELATSAEHYRRAVELSPYLAWAANPAGEVDFIGPSIEDERHRPVAERFAAWVARMHEDDLPALQQAWQTHRQQAPAPFQTEFRMRWADGQWRWMRSRANPLVDEQGHVLRWFGLITDVSREKALEQEVAQLREQLARGH